MIRLVVFINGHGKEIDDGPRKGLGEIGNIREDFLQGDLARFDPGVHIVVILNSCESGSFSDSMSKVADITLVSTSNRDSSYGDLDFWTHGTRDSNSDDEGSEFVSSIVEGWKKVMSEKAIMDAARLRAEQSGTSFWEEVSAMAFVFGLDYDAHSCRSDISINYTWNCRNQTRTLSNATNHSHTRTHSYTVPRFSGRLPDIYVCEKR